ncbi:hypothetical protein PCIT_a1976 [Pseudoalteromonas citrea]|uniref:Uncharacterized protein n=2 Tax=Pseudoalteromonas citrea TaxID=43655 RepID=A0AAD4FS75_9GAMM|nr:hypothetical protein [Pseudoalteromonas citrea]KAF7771998.1 hypothetical protein PCIT_a1976 [Pseudoalteromonas citrea]
MITMIMLIVAALLFSGASVFSFCKANYCACNHAGECDNPINHYWLASIVFSLFALACCCIALHAQNGTYLWILLMSSCLSGALLSARKQKLKQCDKTKPVDDLLTGGIN